MHLIPKSIKIESDFRKPGRFLTQYNADDISKWLGMPWDQIRNPYRVTFESRAIAANHYHLYKKELIEVTYGMALIACEHPETKERFEFTVSHNPLKGHDQAVLIPQGYAHAVKPLTDFLALQVWTPNPAREPGADIEYKVL